MAVALFLILRQGRLLELMYGAYCWIMLPPNQVQNRGDFDVFALINQAEKEFTERDSLNRRLLKLVGSRALGEDSVQGCTFHGLTQYNEHFVLGEYAHNSARVYIISPHGVQILEPYKSDLGVCHIHLVHHHADRIYIATGDSRKYLDSFEWDGHTIQLRDRILRHFGGFTAGCSIGSRSYFGTDFSGRPNYIYCMETGKVFGFPFPAYLEYCVAMLAIEQRFIVCLTTSAPFAEPRRSISIFDSASNKFIYSGLYSGLGFKFTSTESAQADA